MLLTWSETCSVDCDYGNAEFSNSPACYVEYEDIRHNSERHADDADRPVRSKSTMDSIDAYQAARTNMPEARSTKTAMRLLLLVKASSTYVMRDLRAQRLVQVPKQRDRDAE